MRVLIKVSLACSIALAGAAPCHGNTGMSQVVTDSHGRRSDPQTSSPRVLPGVDMTASESPRWASVGPFGGDVFAIGISPVDTSVVLAGIAPHGGAGGTMYRSIDAGASWIEVTCFTGTSVYSLEYTPDGNVYAGTQDGVWKSQDNGESWTKLYLGIGDNDTVKEIAIDPGEPASVWAGVADHMGGQARNVIMSTDAGDTWSDVTPPLSIPISCRAITFDPNDPDHVFASFGGSFGGGAFWVSTDYGRSWSNRSLGLPGNPLVEVVHDGDRLLVTGGQLFGSQNVGLYESHDDGVSWTSLHDSSWPIMAFNDLALDPDNHEVIYLASLGAGVYVSTDGGASWTFGFGGTEGLSVNTICFSPSGSGVMYLGASSIGVLKGTISDSDFYPSSVGIGALQVTSITANPNDPDQLAIGFESLNSGGIYTSHDTGRTWILEAVPGTRWRALRFHPDGTLYAVSDGPSNIADEGLYRRNVDGTWTSLGPDQGPYFESEIGTVEFGTIDLDRFFLGGADFGVAGDEATIWSSSDAGITWQKVYEGLNEGGQITDIAITRDGLEEDLLASMCDFGGSGEGGVLRSSDSGITWTVSSTGLDPQAQGYALASSPFDTGTFYFADGNYGQGGVFKTTDTGQSWSCTGFRGVVYGLVTDHRNEDILYIMQSNDGRVLRSVDGGANFKVYGTGMETAGWGRELVYSVGPEPRLMLATNAGSFLCDLRLDHVLLRRGRVNSGAGVITDVLFVNGGTGDSERKVTVSHGMPVIVSMDAPPKGPFPAPFVLYILMREAGFRDPADQPLGLGFACFPMPLSTGSPLPPPLTVANNVGFEHVLGSPILKDILPAPAVVFSLDDMPVGSYTLQGLVYDDGSSAEIGASLTNAVLLEVLP